MLARLGVRVAPRTVGMWLIGLSVPLLAGWITAAAMSNASVLSGPFWAFVVWVFVGLLLIEWDAVAARINLPERVLHRKARRAGSSISGFGHILRLQLSEAVVIEEIISAVAFFFLFSALIHT